MDNIPSKITGDQWLATEVNTVAEELENSVTQTGQTLGADNLQLTRGIAQAASGGQYFESVHSTGVYTVTPNSTAPAIIQQPHKLVDGLVVRFIADANSAANDQLKLGTLTAGDIRVPGGGSNISANDIKTGDYVECIYRVGSLTWELVPSIFRDEDDMASDSAVAVPSQQSVKAYADAIAPVGYAQVDSNAGASLTASSPVPLTLKMAEGGLITYDTATKKFTLTAGYTYKLFAMLWLSFGGSGDDAQVQWYDETIGALTGNIGLHQPVNNTGPVVSSVPTYGIVNLVGGTTDHVVYLKVNSVSSGGASVSASGRNCVYAERM